MNPSRRCLSPAQASAALGVSAKALRLYERHGLLRPDRTQSGWRTYDASAMHRAAEIVALRGLGLTLIQVARVLDGSSDDRDASLAAHETRLSQRGTQTALAIERVRALRADAARGHALLPPVSTSSGAHETPLGVGFALPWPWAGEWYALAHVPRLAFITGPLGSGKTRFAQTLAAALPDALFLGLDRLSDRSRAEDEVPAANVESRIVGLVEAGATRSPALTTLLNAFEARTSEALVIDMVEDGLDAVTQTVLMAHLRRHGTNKRTLFLMTRSSAILDLDALEPGEVVILCPANHGMPLNIVPFPGGRGYEAVATCIASPDVRARIAGVMAMRAQPI